ncbi:MAG TPA: AsmA family protein, partial [Flavobacteriales bacterium]|nr:AsmA family protein [Flavobacteriales bacterium]
MSKWIKRIFITLAVLIVLVLAAAIILPYVFRDKIEAAVKLEVNKNINAIVNWGEWDITILKSFPDLTVDIADVKVSGNAPFEGVDLARIGSLTATIDIKSVFGDKIDIKRVGLIKPYIHIRVLEDGKANYDIAIADSAAVETPSDTASSLSFGLREYFIENGHIIYEDLSLPVSMDLANVQHKGSGDFRQDLFTLETKTTIDS